MPISNVRSSPALAGCLALAATLALGAGIVKADTQDRAPKPRSKPPQSAPAQAPSTAPTDVAIINRQAWQAKPPVSAMKGHVPVAILVHHTASAVNNNRDIHYKMRSLQAYSQKPVDLGDGRKRAAWADVPYHFYIAADGSIAEGRDINFSGDTNTNYDTTGFIQVVLEGNFEKTRPTVKQMEAIEPLLVSLARKWKVPASEIRVHKEVAATLCPGKNFLDLFLDLNDRVGKQLKPQ